jgi:peptidoglycan DL-endopeptidase CwlO
VELLPHGRYGKTAFRGSRVRTSFRRGWGRAAVLAGSATLLSVLLPSGISSAAKASDPPASLKATVAQANKLSNEIDSLGQQYDNLRIQLTQALAEAKIAHETAQREQKALGLGQASVAKLAAEGFMVGGFNPTIQLLQSQDPQSFLDRASIMLQLQHQQGSTVSLLASATAAANRATLTATQQAAQAKKLTSEMSKKVAQIQAKENVLNSAAFSQALTVFRQTGTYPNIGITSDSIGAQALKFALSQIGKPYVWGAAGPNSYDCSGLVMWAYGKVGISLEHFTGDQWLEGEHVSRSQLEPGDLVFFFPDISHVGLYLGNGLMVDAPSAGQDVQIQPIFWDEYVGAVRIVA